MMLKYIYKKYRKQIHDMVIADLLLEIPPKITRPAIEVLSAKRESVVKWLYYEANAVARRSPIDFGNLERRNGILIMIQALISAVSNSSFEEEKVVVAKEKPIQKDWKQGVDAFTAKPKI